MRFFLSLFTLLFCFNLTNAQNFSYWLEREYDMGDGQKASVTFYSASKGTTAYIKMVNESCFDLQYDLEVGFLRYGDTSPFYNMKRRGVLNAKKSLTFSEDDMGGTHQIKLNSVQDEYGWWKSKTQFSSVRPREEWTNHARTLNCLGYSSPNAYRLEKEAEAEAIRKADEDRTRAVEMEKERKLKRYLDKGPLYHLSKYEKKNKNGGFFQEIPYDSAEIIAKHTGRYLLICNTGGSLMSKEQLKLTDKDFNFLNDNFIAIQDISYNRSFIDWIKLKDIKVPYTPVVILVNPKGEVILNQSMAPQALTDNFAGWLRKLDGQL